MASRRTADILMWVGASHYLTVESFVREAARMGVSKRVANVPERLRLEKSLLFLAHDEASRIPCRSCRGRGIKKGKIRVELSRKSGRGWAPTKTTVEVSNARAFRKLRDKAYAESSRTERWSVVKGQDLCQACAGRGEVPDGRIFGVCRVDQLELVFDCAAAASEYRERRQRSGKKDRVPVTYVPGIDKEPRRRAGYRKIGGLYITTGGQDAPVELMELARELGWGFTTRGPLVVFPEPVAYPEGRFRAAKVVDGRTILKQARSLAAAARKPKAKKGSKRRGSRDRSTTSR